MQGPSTHIGMCLPTRHIGMDLSFHAGPVRPISMCLPSRHIGYVFHPITSGCELHPGTSGCPTTSGCLPSPELIGLCLASSNRYVSSIPTRGWRCRPCVIKSIYWHVVFHPMTSGCAFYPNTSGCVYRTPHRNHPTVPKLPPPHFSPLTLPVPTQSSLI